MDIEIRPARPDDRAAIAAFTEDTFAWGDYVPDSFDDWLAAADSEVLVATTAGTPVALARVVQLSPDEIWLHAARVQPSHRRQGLGLALNRACLQWGRDRGAVVARLMIEDWNEAARLQVERGGYRRIANWFHARREVHDPPPSPTGPGLRPPEPLRIAPRPEAEGAFMSWSTSELARAAHGLRGERWHFRQMTIDHLIQDAERRHLWEAPSGWISIEHGPDGNAWVAWLMTTPGEAELLVAALLTKLRSDGAMSVSVLLPRLPWLIAAFEASGFDVHPNGIWEIRVD
ncbi:MAG: GNAT family N-acetyltransferase [Acidimicrobiia bacterium]|nr:GNAT family N-acetyltransferase [Acidimicrobiia bacterium]